MTENQFWELFDTVQREIGDWNKYVSDPGMNALREKLKALPPAEITDFARHFDQKRIDAYRWDLWAAGYIIAGGCSDDGFIDFRSELISRGRAVFEAALEDVESLADAPGPPIYGMEGWQYLADEAYESVTGQRKPHHGLRTPADPSGEAWDEDTVNALYPKLAAKFAG